MRILKWLLGIVAVAALAFFALAPGIIERGMNKVERASPWPVSAQDWARVTFAAALVITTQGRSAFRPIPSTTPA